MIRLPVALLFAALAAGVATPARASSQAPAAVGTDTTWRALHGRVVSDVTGDPIAYAWVELDAGARRRGTVADAQGRYLLIGVPAGDLSLRARALGHAPLELTVHVPVSGEVSLDVGLRPLPIGLPVLNVVSDPGPSAARSGLSESRGSPAEVELRVLEATPGAVELGIVSAPATEPDPEPASVLYVRGAASDLKLVLLDGAPVYAPFHLGGLLAASHPGVLDSARLYVGGAPARFDGALSYILDLATRRGRRERAHTSGAVDGLGVRARVEGPLGPVTALAAGRVLHGWGAQGFTSDRLPYGYREVLTRLDADLGEDAGLAATAFANRETVRLDGGGLTGTAYWGNVAGSLRLHGRVGSTDAEITGALAEFATELPMGSDTVRIGHGRSRRLRLGAHFGSRAGAGRLEYGATLERHRIALRSLGATAQDTLTRAHRALADTWGAYADGSWPVGPDVELRGGLRVSGFPTTGELRLGPRVSAAWKASEHSTLSIAAGRYHQYVRTSETILAGDLEAGWGLIGPERSDTPSASSSPAGDAIGGWPALTVAGATHWVVRLDHAPRDEVRLGLEGFLKTFDAGAELSGLRAAGADLWFDWQSGPWAASAGYSLAWVWATGPEATTDTVGPAPDRFAGRQLLSAGVRAPLPARAQLDIHLATSTGLPFSAVPITTGAAVPGQSDGLQTESGRAGDPRLAGAPDGSYLRLDAEISRTWQTRLLGSRARIRPYVRVLNALDRRDALFYQFDAGADLRPRSLGAVPLLPIAGVEWSL